ncbi:Hypothetical predicted protein [Lecanosticta acicola]|uniref:Uncharacterized protein n=1 Tax=Lecanosticta acicola TaxID=111012 RepID=A0AAI8Z919_9PEZI|nr:Hypothetical predicted protein [Lecanosticta acicola]
MSSQTELVNKISAKSSISDTASQPGNPAHDHKSARNDSASRIGSEIEGTLPEDETTGEEEVHAEQEAVKSASPSKGKKRQAEESPAPSAAAKKQKIKATPKPKRNGNKPTNAAEPAASKKKRIKNSIRNKIDQITAFLSSSAAASSRLDRDSGNKHFVTIKESALLGALMALRADWEVSDPRQASLLDAEEVVVREFAAPVGTEQIPARFMVIDLSKRTTLESSIHLKIENWGLDGIGLLEAELEMYAKQLEQVAAFVLLEAVEEACGSEPSSPSPLPPAETAAKPAAEPAAKPAADPAAKPAVEAAAESTAKPAAESASE